jgi:N-dimethylarginine dimethylaminohydrolase
MTQKILMCRPDFFGVDYVINPWMQGNVGQSNHALAAEQWNALHALLEQQAEIVLVEPQKGWPDMVFTANAGLVFGNRVIASIFHAPQRQGETPHFVRWFGNNGFELADWPESVPFEGAGDGLFDRKHPWLWLGHGFRSSPKAAALLEEKTGRKVIPLHLVNPSFYHLDTCLCPLSGGKLLYHPPAFDAESNARIESLVPEADRIVVEAGDAAGFVCNAVELGGKLFVNHASPALQHTLARNGFEVVITPLGEFMKAGGAAKCLTLKLIEP